MTAVSFNIAVGVKLSLWRYAVDTKLTASYFIVEPVAVAAAGTLLQEIETTIFETPSHVNVGDEPAPVPKVKVFTTPAVGVKPSSGSVPA